MITTINDFKNNDELIKLCNYLYKWLDGGNDYSMLQNNLEFKKLIDKYSHQFKYDGIIYRATHDKTFDKNKLVSFSSNIESLCTLLDIFQYGGMIDDFNNLPIYIDNITNGFNVNLFINYCNKLKIFNADYLYYLDYNEIITHYNNPKLKYYFNFTNNNICNFGYQAMELSDVNSDNKKTVCSKNFL